VEFAQSKIAGPGPALPSFSADRLFSRTMVDAGHLARQGERMVQTLKVAAERFGWDHGMRLQGQLRILGRVGDRVCAYAFGPGVLHLDARDYALATFAGIKTPEADDNGFLLAHRAWSEMVTQVLDLQCDLVGVWLDLGRDAVGVLPGFAAAPDRRGTRG
jgi:hypothetical protein